MATITMHGVTLEKLPMPHSVNKNFLFSKGRFIKSKEARAFDAAVYVWALANKKKIDAARVIVGRWVTEGYLLTLDIDFFFQRSRLFSKKGSVKMIDLNNRLKPIVDAVSKLVEVDDRFFFQHTIRKVGCADFESESCVVRIDCFQNLRDF